VYGNKPKKLFNPIKINRAIHNKLAPGTLFLPVTAENSELTNLTPIIKIVTICLLNSQNKLGSPATTIKEESQFKGKFMLVTGSKIENRLDMFDKVKLTDDQCETRRKK
jgi:hypothetical protein